MKRFSEERVKRWEDMSDAITNMYLKIIKYEQHNDVNEEYKAIIELMPTALRLEKDIFHEIGINKDNYKLLERRFNISDEDVTDANDGDEVKLSMLRKHNYFTSMLNFQYGLASSANEIYSELYHSQITVNFIKMLERYCNEIDDEDVKNFLIYIKYLLISTVPIYESDYFLLGQKTLPTRDILATFPPIHGYTEETIHYHVVESLKKHLSDEIQIIAEINNMILPYYKRAIYKNLALNKARLISLNKKDFILSMQDEINKHLRRNDFYSDINVLIDDMFEDALTLVNETKEKRL